MDELNHHLRRESGEDVDEDISEHGNATDDILGSGFLNEDDD